MRMLIALSIFLTSGCAYQLSLFPRGGGDVARGTGNSGSKEMRVTLNGETYSGKYVRGQTVGYGLASAFGRNPQTASALMVGETNQFVATLASGTRALRCEFMAESHGGSGICVDSMNRVYDLVIEPQ